MYFCLPRTIRTQEKEQMTVNTALHLSDLPGYQPNQTFTKRTPFPFIKAKRDKILPTSQQQYIEQENHGNCIDQPHCFLAQTHLQKMHLNEGCLELSKHNSGIYTGEAIPQNLMTHRLHTVIQSSIRRSSWSYSTVKTKPILTLQKHFCGGAAFSPSKLQRKSSFHSDILCVSFNTPLWLQGGYTAGRGQNVQWKLYVPPNLTYFF